MTQIALAPIRSFLASTAPFDQLSDAGLNQLCAAVQLLRYRMGQAVIVNNALPAQVVIVYQGQVRLVAHKNGSPAPETLAIMTPGAMLGWISLIRNRPCEMAIASTESTCVVIPVNTFLALLKQERQLAPGQNLFTTA